MSIFDFNEDDLEANRHGQLSPRQKEWLQANARHAQNVSRRETYITVACLVLGLGILLVWSLLTDSIRTVLFSNPLLLVAGLASLFLLVPVIALAVFNHYRDVSGIGDSVLAAVSGVVQLGEGSPEESNFTSYYVFVGTKKFVFGEGMSAIFKEGEKYKVYYCESGRYKLVMSYEQQLQPAASHV